MKNILRFEPLTPKTYNDYIKVGTLAYNQHYLHLWPNGDSTPYITNSFTFEILQKEEQNKNTHLYTIKLKTVVVGILKFTLNAKFDMYPEEEALYIDKIYLLNEYSGRGLGKKTLQFVLLRAEEISKKIVWLAAMQKGPAVNFYQQNGFEVYGESETSLPILEKEKHMYIMVKKISD